MYDFPIFRKPKVEKSDSPVRSVTIDTVEWEGSYACDVVVIRQDNTKEIHPTGLYLTVTGAVNAAKKIRSKFL